MPRARCTALRAVYLHPPADDDEKPMLGGRLHAQHPDDAVKRYLKDDGLLVQWVQAYEINPGLLSTIFQALGKHFADYTGHLTDRPDVHLHQGDGRPQGHQPRGLVGRRGGLARGVEDLSGQTGFADGEGIGGERSNEDQTERK